MHVRLKHVDHEIPITQNQEQGVGQIGLQRILVEHLQARGPEMRQKRAHLEELVNAAGGDSRPTLITVDGVGLPTARLAVRKDADVVAIHCRLDQVLGVFEHLLRWNW